MKEEWKDIKDYEGLYQVSNWGRVKSLITDKNRRKRILKQHNRGNGYLFVVLTNNEHQSKNISVHRLVAETFLPNPENLPEVNHIDENKENNRVDNLEWCDHTYNINYGNRTKKASESKLNGKKSKSVLQFSLTGDFIREWTSTMECGRNGFNQGAVAACCRGKLLQYKGFYWMYK